jgi:hypothetical protein
MATVVNKGKVLSAAGEVTVIQQINNGKKEAHMCREFSVVNSTIKNDLETQKQINSAFEQNG